MSLDMCGSKVSFLTEEKHLKRYRNLITLIHQTNHLKGQVHVPRGLHILLCPAQHCLINAEDGCNSDDYDRVQPAHEQRTTWLSNYTQRD